MQDEKTVPIELYEQLKQQYDSVNHQLEWFKRQLFGCKSEKRIVDDAADQGNLFSNPDSSLISAQPTVTEKIPGYTRRKKQRENCVNESGLRFSDAVPVQIIKMPCKELEGVNADDYIVISEKVTHRLAQRPGSYVILKYIRKVVKHKIKATITTSLAPAAVFDNSLADVSFLAGMLIDKFNYHLPFYRQHQRLSQNGVELSRRILTTLSHRSISLLKPIVDAQLTHCLQSQVLAMDETPIKAGRTKKGKMHQGYFWPVYGDSDEVVFIYASGRGENVIHDTLKGFTGTLLTDGYDAYARYAKKTESVTAANCWAHTRRGFDKALNAEPEAANEALALISELYQHEEHIRSACLTGKEKFLYRQSHSKPILERFWPWCDEQCYRHDLLPSNPLSKALNYAIKRKAELEVFLGDPQVAIDTNHLERALRPIPMGKKNWLFCWTEVGAEDVGAIQSLLVTCRIQGINPYVYLVDVLLRVSQHPANLAHELTPRLWKEKFAKSPMRSDLDNIS